jgi:hypothetical protein
LSVCDFLGGKTIWPNSLFSFKGGYTPASTSKWCIRLFIILFYKVLQNNTPINPKTPSSRHLLLYQKNWWWGGHDQGRMLWPDTCVCHLKLEHLSSKSSQQSSADPSSWGTNTLNLPCLPSTHRYDRSIMVLTQCNLKNHFTLCYLLFTSPCQQS